MKTQQIIRQLLLSFVLISIGFALGRETGRRSAAPAAGDVGAPASAGTSPADRVLVYYFFGPIRCTTCNKIEATAKEVVQSQFAKEVQAGRVEWKTANFQENESLAKRYDIASSTLVIVKQHEGKDVKSQKLDEVWTLVNNKPGFVSYVQGAVRSYLEGGQ